MKRWWWAVLLLGCTSPNGGGGPVGSSGVDAKFGASLTVQRAYRIDADAVAVDLVLANMGTTPLPFSAGLFSVETAEGLSYAGVLTGGCDPTAKLVGGHSVACQVAFRPRAGAEITAVLYTLPDDRTLRAAVDVPGCDTCGGACVDVKSDPNNCGACGVSVSACNNGIPSCTNGLLLCDQRCVNGAFDSDNCGACGHQCDDTASCVDGACVQKACKDMNTVAECYTCCQGMYPGEYATAIDLTKSCACQGTLTDCSFQCKDDFCATSMVNDNFCFDCLQHTCTLDEMCLYDDSGCSNYKACVKDCSFI
jgi:hypothetical protein